MADLVSYARGDAALDSDVHEYLITLLEVLSPPVGGAEAATGIDAAIRGERDVDELGLSVLDRLALVCCAALGREAIEQGRPVSAGWLAALGGCSTTQVRNLARSGELERVEDGEISAQSAKRWLRGRRDP